MKYIFGEVQNWDYVNECKESSETLTPCCKLDKLHPTFPQFSFEYPIVSTVRSLEVLFFEIFRRVNKSWNYFVKQRVFLMLFHGFLDIFEANSNKKLQLLL